MSVNYATSLKTERMQLVNEAIGNGGTLEIQTSGGGVLAVIPLEYPAGFVVGAVLTFNGTPLSDDAANNSGTAAKAQIKDSDGNVVIDGLTVSATSGDIILASTAVVASLPVTLASATITHG